jgi:transcriptional regulator with XRE-family HTH domain
MISQQTISERDVKALLRERGMTLTRLAELSGVSRPHLSLVLRNEPGRGAQVRRKVARFLRGDELQALGWTAGGERK